MPRRLAKKKKGAAICAEKRGVWVLTINTRGDENYSGKKYYVQDAKDNGCLTVHEERGMTFKSEEAAEDFVFVYVTKHPGWIREISVEKCGL